MERQGGRLFLATFHYAADGTAQWAVSTLGRSGPTAFAGTLELFGGGQALGMSDRPALDRGPLGPVT
ncbi:hypothetical protein ACKI16_46580, partial [Streptomyces scabiei]|uniref:hypothetical protein n=1 Tax=Streptomyces scabiei TaxID=1930 RepID=UPI0038F7042E